MIFRQIRQKSHYILVGVTFSIFVGCFFLQGTKTVDQLKKGSVLTKSIRERDGLSSQLEGQAPIGATRFQTKQLAPSGQQAARKLQTLKDVLTSHDDNDPRLDKDLLSLDPETKVLFRDFYRTISAEKRNDRGIIVFLLGRNLDHVEDFNFLQEVLNETPCLSLADCNRFEVGGQDRESDEHQVGFGAILAYPQLVALHSLANYAARNSQSPFIEITRDLVFSATHSKVPELAKMADSILAKSR